MFRQSGQLGLGHQGFELRGKSGQRGSARRSKHQLVETDAQDLRQPHQFVDPEELNASLDVRQPLGPQAGLLGEDVLSPPQYFAEMDDPQAQLPEPARRFNTVT